MNRLLRHRRIPLLLAMLVAASVFGFATWMAAHLPMTLHSVEQVVASVLVAAVGGVRAMKW